MDIGSDEPKVNIIEIFRLSQSQYEKFEKSLLYNNVIVGNDTSGIQAGYMLGLQKALLELRNGFTIGV